MKTTVIKLGIAAALALFIGVSGGCQKDEMRIYRHDPSIQPAPTDQRSSFFQFGAAEVRLSDTKTAGVGAINLQIQRISVHYADPKIGFGGWIYFPTRSFYVNTLLYQDGKNALLGASSHLPVGLIDRVRIEFGDNSWVVWGDSNGKHEIKLSIIGKDHMGDADVNINLTHTTKLGFILNFDADASIDHEEGMLFTFHPSLSVSRITHDGRGDHSEETQDDMK